MRIILCLAISLVACTKQNPDLCCVDEADCANVGLEEVKDCGDGLLCRGNQCIAELCDTSAECDADAPYCVLVPEGRCQMECTDDTQCPGFGEAADQTFCENAACVQCRASGDDCNGATPVCDAGRCVGCVRNDQCASGVCVEDGSCADESDVAYVAADGEPTGDCVASAPCNTIEFALAAVPARPFIVIDSGTYSRSATIRLFGARRLIGRGPTRPIIRRAGMGPIFTIDDGVFGLEFLDIAGATGTSLEDDSDGSGVMCPIGNNGNVRLVDAIVRDNVTGIRARMCTMSALRTELHGNSIVAVAVTDSNVSVERSTISDNGKGLVLDAGNFTITNNFITRNQNVGIELFAAGTEQLTAEFNTIVDNGLGFICNVPGASMPNNIIARNTQSTGSSSCSFPSSIIASDVTTLNFVSPDGAPFDYHIESGSVAVDAATITTIDLDFDGDPRPSSGADVGADEL